MSSLPNANWDRQPGGRAQVSIGMHASKKMYDKTKFATWQSNIVVKRPIDHLKETISSNVNGGKSDQLCCELKIIILSQFSHLACNSHKY
jgi:hypothetical protein